MQATSYDFSGSGFQGMFHETTTHIPEGSAPLGWKLWSTLSGLVFRADKEQPIAATPLAAAFPRPTLPLGNWTSGPYTQMVDWQHVPAFLERPFSHKLSDMFIKLYYGFRAELPFPVSNLEGTIYFYILPALDAAGNVKATVDSTSADVHGGWPANDFFRDLVRSGAESQKKTVEQAVNFALSVQAPGTWKNLYVLPGDGSNAPSGFGDGMSNTTLVLVR